MGAAHGRFLYWYKFYVLEIISNRINKGEHMFKYYQVDLKLLTPMLGTATEASIWKQHVLEKTKKEIAKLNKITTKITKASEKYGKTEISNEKEIAEIKGCIRATEEALGKKSELPDTLQELIEHADLLREEFETAIKAGQ